MVIPLHRVEDDVLIQLVVGIRFHVYDPEAADMPTAGEIDRELVECCRFLLMSTIPARQTKWLKRINLLEALRKLVIPQEATV